MITIDFEVLNVGQGNANFIIVKRDGKIVTTFLIDIGTQREKSDLGAIASAGYIADVLSEMTAPHIAAVVLSHRDKDHIVLLPTILKRFKTRRKAPAGTPRKEILVIDGIFYGGSRKDYERARAIFLTKNLIKDTEAYLDSRLENHIGRTPFPFNHSHFRDTVPLQFWPWYGEVEQIDADGNKEMVVPTPRGGDLGISLSALAVNVDPRKPAEDDDLFDKEWTGMEPNAGSLVVALLTRPPGTPERDGRVAFVATGDATGVTLRRLQPWIKDSQYFPDVFHLTAPHHGAFRTSLSDEALKADRIVTVQRVKKPEIEDTEAAKTLRRFSRKIQAKTISASAGISLTYGHPSVTVLAALANYNAFAGRYADSRLTPPHDRNHFITVWMERYMTADTSGGPRFPQEKSGYVTLQTDAAVYTTLYLPSHKDVLSKANYVYAFNADRADNGVTEIGAAPTINQPGTRSWIFSVTEDGTRSMTARPEDDNPMESLMKTGDRAGAVRTLSSMRGREGRRQAAGIGTRGVRIIG